MTHADSILKLEDILSHKIHGLSYSPYMDGQQPGDGISEAQIEQRLKIIQPYTRWIRTFSCTEGHEHTPRIAHQQGLKTMVGISLSDDKYKNDIEMINGIEIARLGFADILAVGNETLLRGDLSEAELLEYIARAKQAVPDVPICYVDAYFLFEVHPKLVDACDVISINCYPFWEYCHVDYSLLYIKDMYRRTLDVAKGKKVVISETGWPSAGDACGPAVPSCASAMRYFINTYVWAEQEGIDIFYFSSFDESWKRGDEGDVGAYWGLWDVNGNFKYHLSDR
ncbi:MAG: glycosyl hydrolase family 17 protein [Ghiorsea sp.]